MLEDLRSLCRAAQAHEEQHGDDATLTGFLEQAAGLHAHEIAPGEPDRRITVSTIHRSKGTEAQLVVLLGCEERLLPFWRALQSPDGEQLAEERRLFYVACTRAKDQLILTHAATRGGRPTGGPSRFLSEAGLIEPVPGARRLNTNHARKEHNMPNPNTDTPTARRRRPRARTRRPASCCAGRSRPARSAFAP